MVIFLYTYCRKQLSAEISGSHGSKYEDGCLWGCCDAYPGRDRGLITLMMEAASTSETLVNLCKTTSHNNSEDSHLQLYTTAIAWILKNFIIPHYVNWK
jgi:hypothetical protein